MTNILEVHGGGSWNVPITGTSVHASGSWHPPKGIWAHGGGSWNLCWVPTRNVMVAGTSGVSGIHGYENSALGSSFGTITPSNDSGSHTIYACNVNSGGAFSYWLFTGSSIGQSYFTNLYIMGIDIGVITLASSAATYSYNGSFSSSTWLWSSGPALTVGNTYYIGTV